jgi:hypothetical protein
LLTGLTELAENTKNVYNFLKISYVVLYTKVVNPINPLTLEGSSDGRKEP